MAASRRNPEAQLADLQRKYVELQQQNRELLRRLVESIESDSAFHRLGWFALQWAASAFAVFHEGHVRVANQRWHALARAHDGSQWILQDGRERRAYGDLGTLCATELARLVETRDTAATYTVLCKDESQALRLRLEPVKTRGAASMGLVFADDVTAERQQSAELSALRDGMAQRERLSALGRLAAGIVHDLGNTLNALSLRLQVADRSSPDRARQEMASMKEAIDDMRATLERLDRFAGRRTAPLKPVDLRGVITAAVALIAPELGSDARRRVKVELALPHRLPRVVGHAADLQSVFVNLLVNARDAMPRGGTVTVEALAGREEVVVRVCDEGTGIAPEHLSQVFEPFFSTKGARGSGLGLSLAYGVVHATGGNIRAANRPTGGVEITLQLPVASSVLARSGGRRAAEKRRARR